MFGCDAYSATYPVANSTSGQANYAPCPYSTPPTSTYTRPNAEAYVSTALDGTVYYCNDSRYLDHNVNNCKSCVTSMSSISVVSSIHVAYTSSVAAASSASAAAASPTNQICINYKDPQGWGFYVYWFIFNPSLDDTCYPGATSMRSVKQRRVGYRRERCSRSAGYQFR